jgi:hypothetical protein
MAELREKPSIEYLEAGFQHTLKGFFQEIKDIDALIYEYSILLEKAQPLFSGRVLVRFSKRGEARTKIGDEFYYDKTPCVGKMLKKQDGSWIFIWIEKVDIKNLEKYRVSLNTPWDKQVIAILKNLSPLLLRREVLIQSVKKMKMEFIYASQSNQALQLKAKKDLDSLKDQVHWDFRNNAKELLQEFFQNRKTI